MGLGRSGDGPINGLQKPSLDDRPGSALIRSTGLERPRNFHRRFIWSAETGIDREPRFWHVRCIENSVGVQLLDRETEDSFWYASLDGLSIRRFSSASGHTNSTKSTSPPPLATLLFTSSMNPERTVPSGANVDINPVNRLRQACSNTDSQIPSRSSTNGGLPKSNTDRRRSTTR